jgi:hypothetical protein
MGFLYREDPRSCAEDNSLQNFHHYNLSVFLSSECLTWRLENWLWPFGTGGGGVEEETDRQTDRKVTEIEIDKKQISIKSLINSKLF